MLRKQRFHLNHYHVLLEWVLVHFVEVERNERHLSFHASLTSCNPGKMVGFRANVTGLSFCRASIPSVWPLISVTITCFVTARWLLLASVRSCWPGFLC